MHLAMAKVSPIDHAALLVLQAFMLFEEAIPDSAGERVALASIVGALHRCRVFPPEPRATLVHKATGYSAKLLRKADQCRAVLACSHLFWQVASGIRCVFHCLDLNVLSVAACLCLSPSFPAAFLGVFWSARVFRLQAKLWFSPRREMETRR